MSCAPDSATVQKALHRRLAPTAWRASRMGSFNLMRPQALPSLTVFDTGSRDAVALSVESVGPESKSEQQVQAESGAMPSGAAASGCSDALERYSRFPALYKRSTW